jgi:hypothetical protein
LLYLQVIRQEVYIERF